MGGNIGVDPVAAATSALALGVDQINAVRVGNFTQKFDFVQGVDSFFVTALITSTYGEALSTKIAYEVGVPGATLPIPNAHAPVITMPQDLQITASQQSSTTLEATVSDADGDVVECEWFYAPTIWGSAPPPTYSTWQKVAESTVTGQGTTTVDLGNLPALTPKAYAFMLKVSDGWPAYNQLERAGWRRERHMAIGPRGGKFRPVIPGISLIFGNLKTWLRGQFHGVSDKYLHSYVAEFTYRYNRRRDPPEIFGWVMRRLAQRPPQGLESIRWAVEPSG